MLKEGIFLVKRYEILERIGSGGMADVYKGKDHKLNRYVAVKVLKSDYRSDEVFIQKFLSEAQAAAGLMHPNIVNVYDVGQDRGLYFMVMELVEGITLKEYIEKKKRLTPKETISIAIQMVTGIQAAHSQHIIHRDIKPQNIMISKEGKVKVTDFGIARATTSSSTISTNVMGSVHYTSPEQARGGVVDEKSDIYSAGITMYEMVTGHVPFDGDSTVSVAIKHLQEEMPSPSAEVPDIPRSLENIIMKCTQKNTARRYQNCGELLTDLKRCIMGSPAEKPKRDPGRKETVVMAEDEIDRARKRKPQRVVDPYDREDDYDEDEDRGGGYDDRDRYRRRKEEDEEDIEPDTRKIIKILLIVAGVIIALVLIFLVGRAAGFFRPQDPDVTNEEEAGKVLVPNLLDMTEEEAQKEANDRGLGFVVVERRSSDRYEEGRVMEQKIAANEKVDKNTAIEVVISTGEEIKRVQVPYVVGETDTVAQDMLERENLIVNFEGQYNDDVEAGTVISTDPVYGSMVDEGSTVTIYVSRGSEKVPVPDLKGKTAEAAEKELSVAGLRGSASEEYSDTYEKGTVVSQTQVAGSRVEKNTVIEYVVSKGPSVEMVEVPRLVGQNEENARKLLEDAGFTVGTVAEGYNAVVTDGQVLSQTVSPGTEMPKGSSIGFTVNRIPESQEPENNENTNPVE